MLDFTISLIATLLILPGIAIAFVPMLPALTYMFVVALVFALYDGFATLTGNELLVLFGFVAVSFIVDHSSGLIGAKYGGAHTKSLFWGILGSVVGTFILPPLGTFIGLFLAVLFAEIYYKKSHDKALKAATSALIGTAFGVGVNIVLAITFVVFFCFFVFFP